MKFTIEVLAFLGFKNHLIKSNKILKTIFLDSRQCDADSIFIALKGQSADGNKYIDNAIAKEVSLVLTDNVSLDNITKDYSQIHSHNDFFDKINPKSFVTRIKIIYVENLEKRLSKLAKWFYNYRKPKNIIGITGTNGKTSISNYIAQFLQLNQQKTLLLGTNGNGIYPNLQQSSHTTLDTLSLYHAIASYQNSQRSVAIFESDIGLQTQSDARFDLKSQNKILNFNSLVMEVSSHSLDQNRTDGLEFCTAIFSNLSHDHFDYHKTMENYFLAKAKLFKLSCLKKSVINIDDKYGKKLVDLSVSPVVTVSLKSKQADVYLQIIKIEKMLTSFNLYFKDECAGEFTTSLIGEFNLMNLALSIGALDSDLNRLFLLKNINKISSVKGRMEFIQLNNGAKAIIDYAHTPDALEKSLQALRKLSKNNLWCLFGCGGDRDKSKRHKMANIAEKYADKIIVTEDNNRFENIEIIFKDIKKGFLNPSNHVFINSRDKAIGYCIKNSTSQDIMLLAGKGHECYIDKNGVKEYFDEREIISKYN